MPKTKKPAPKAATTTSQLAAPPPAQPGAAAPAEAAEPEAQFDSALAQKHFEALRARMAAIPEGELKAASLDLQRAASAALGVATREGEPATHGRYAKLPVEEFSIASLDDLGPAAWAAWYVARQAALASQGISNVQIPLDLSTAAYAVRDRMRLCAEYHLGDHPETSPKLVALRAGTGYRDLINDLQGYAEIYREHDAVVVTDTKHYRPTDLADAERFSRQMFRLLSAGFTPETSAWPDLQTRSFTLLLSLYNEVAATGRWLHRRDRNVDRMFPSLYAFARPGVGRPAKPEPAPEPAPSREPDQG